MKFYAYARPRFTGSAPGWQSYVIAESKNGSRRRSPVRLDENYEVSLDDATDVAGTLQRWHKITGREPLLFNEWEPMISVDPIEVEPSYEDLERQILQLELEHSVLIQKMNDVREKMRNMAR